MAVRKPKTVNVSMSPWYQTQWFAAIIAGFMGLSPWIYDKFQEKQIIQDNIGFSHLFTMNNSGVFTFSTEQKEKINVKIVAGSFDKIDSWIVFNTGKEKLILSRGMHEGEFSAIIKNIFCNSTYFYRPEAMFHGRKIVGSQAQINSPPCKTEAQIKAAKSNPAYRDML